MYQQVPIQKLSHNQILKLLRGQRIRVKHGQGQCIHCSPEQHKKIMSAHKRGQGVTIQFDPFQRQMAEHIALKGKGFIWKDEFGVMHHEGPHMTPMSHGEGWLTDTLKEVAKEVAPHVIDWGANKAKKWVKGEGAPKKRGRPKKGSGIPHIGTPATVPFDEMLSLLDFGSGEKKRGRPKKGGSVIMPPNNYMPLDVERVLEPGPILRGKKKGGAISAPLKLSGKKPILGLALDSAAPAIESGIRNLVNANKKSSPTVKQTPVNIVQARDYTKPSFDKTPALPVYQGSLPSAPSQSATIRYPTSLPPPNFNTMTPSQISTLMAPYGGAGVKPPVMITAPRLKLAVQTGNMKPIVAAKLQQRINKSGKGAKKSPSKKKGCGKKKAPAKKGKKGGALYPPGHDKDNGDGLIGGIIGPVLGGIVGDIIGGEKGQKIGQTFGRIGGEFIPF